MVDYFVGSLVDFLIDSQVDWLISAWIVLLTLAEFPLDSLVDKGCWAAAG